MGFSSFSPLSCSFLQSLRVLPYCSTIPTVTLFNPSLLGFFRLIAYSFLNDLVWSFGLFWLHCASLAHLLSLGPFGHFPNFAFLWAFTNSFGIPWSNYLILHPLSSWTFHQLLTFLIFITSGLLWYILTFLHHILPMGLLLLSFRAPLSPSTSSRPICLFHGPAIHYSYHLGLMVFISTY